MDSKISNKNSREKLIIGVGEKFRACYDAAKIRTLYSDGNYSFIAIVSLSDTFKSIQFI